MNRLVYNAFKAIMLTMIFTFVWDVGFYMFKALNMNQRMLLIMSSMVKTVESNNYLPVDSANTYKAILNNMQTTMNGSVDKSFIYGWEWNYETDNSNISSDSLGTGVRLHTKMNGSDLGGVNYGDVMVVSVKVNVLPPTWIIGRGNLYNKASTAEKVIPFYYRYEVPCLHYVKQ